MGILPGRSDPALKMFFVAAGPAKKREAFCHEIVAGSATFSFIDVCSRTQLMPSRYGQVDKLL
jgi:hypothetical protein